jgi:UDP-N-acetylglucosamine--N-acetylmuramyl-(pentapeptide) pyrophosphoryl-undecaprenol N-acetylglucosamine transferase
MKILFAGGGTGGHFYPIIAIADATREVAYREHLGVIDLYYMSDSPIDTYLLTKTGLSYIEVKTGKRRTYFSIQNFFDLFKIFFACIIATWKLFILYPDVVFGKGGYASFPAMFAARLLHIPVVIHESDIIPGRVNRWIAPYASYVAVSYPEAIDHFPYKNRVALTGQPVRKILLEIPKEDPFEKFALEPDIPVILILGGSQGAEKINEHVIDILPKLVEKYQIIHQTGENNYDWMRKRAAGVFGDNPLKHRYQPKSFLDADELRLAAKAANLVISRAGSTIFEIALWGVPSILIPLRIARDDHQRENAYSYARTGAATIIEEQNLKPELFSSVIDAILSDPERQRVMVEGTKKFAKIDAADKIAQALLSIAAKHD